jgi:thiosulfate dehydrogenase
MATTDRRFWLLVATAPLAVLALAGSTRGDSKDATGNNMTEKDVTVSLCDGKSELTVPGLKPGQVLAPADARKVAADMMQIWRKTEGEVRWASWSAEAAAPSPAPQTSAEAPEASQPTKFTARDQMLWKREEKKWVDEGYKAFHNAKALGGTIGISCDMCHPDATNTHPETYPKFQPQIKKVSHLRDMINWCIENPMKGKPLAENDPVLRSVEAYIVSARKGVALEPGKH